MRVAVIQSNPQENVEENLSKASAQCRAAARGGADLLVLPEMFAYMGPEPGRIKVASKLGDGIFAALSALASELKVVLVGGSHPEISPIHGKVYNTSVTFDATGRVISVYRKIHLFNLWNEKGEKQFCESDTFTPGMGVAGFNLKIGTEDWHAMTAICYDVRFPETFRSQESRSHPYDVILLPAAFTHATGRAHWEPILRTRAIENQCYLVACNQTGEYLGRTKRNYGHSMIISPWGEIIAALEEEEGVLVAQISKDEILGARKKLPAYRNRVLA